MSIKIENLSYTYALGSAYEIHALKNLSLEIHDGEFIGIIGHTGSGKSTLIQLLDGLIKADEGHIYYDGEDIYAPGYSLRSLRGRVGLVFQYPEYQLFETTVLKDAAYGPQNQGFSEEEALEKAREALVRVKLPEKYWEMSPFELSGGQKRRAAIAGVIAMNPKVLILDEPTAGLDPKGRDELFDLIRELHEKMDMTVLLVSHSMEDMANYVQRIVVLNHGTLMLDGTPSEVFSHVQELEQVSLAAPQERGNGAVEERDQEADGADHQIVLRLTPRLRGHIDQTEDRTDEAADDHRDHHCHNRADGKGSSHRPVNALLIFRPAILGDQHRRTGAGPQTDIAGGIADIGHVVYRRQSRRAAELPHNDRIHRGVQGLQYTGRQKWQ